MPDQVTFFGEGGGRVVIEVTGYEREVTDNENDADWQTPSWLSRPVLFPVRSGRH
jgi:hypothetical protein